MVSADKVNKIDGGDDNWVHGKFLLSSLLLLGVILPAGREAIVEKKLLPGTRAECGIVSRV